MRGAKRQSNPLHSGNDGGTGNEGDCFASLAMTEGPLMSLRGSKATEAIPYIMAMTVGLAMKGIASLAMTEGPLMSLRGSEATEAIPYIMAMTVDWQ